MDLPWATGSVTVGDESFAKVGIRYKGNGTIGDASRTIKKSFKIDLGRAGGTGRFGRSKTINLHCGITDPSKCRETLGYELYRTAGVPASRTTLAEVRLTVAGKYNNELLGVYTIVEDVDKSFLHDRFGTDKGLLMKPERIREFEDRGDSWSEYKKTYAPKRDASKDEAARMIAFARLVHKADDATFKREIRSYLDVDGYLRFLAATSFLANSDSFFVLGHNYYLYLHPKTNRLHFIPWDLDRAFANFPILGSNNLQMNLSLTHPYSGAHRLTERLLAVPEISDLYLNLLKELSKTAFEKERLLKRIEGLEAATKERIDQENKAAASRKERAGGFGPVSFGKPPALKVFIEKRTASVLAQVAGTSKGYSPSSESRPGGWPPIGVFMAGPMLETLDTDRDENLSREEWLSIAKKLAATCEKDRNGHINLKSLTAGLNSLLPPPPDGAPPRGFNLGSFMAGSILTRTDVDKDGKITSDELLAAATAIFDEFDKPKTGKLSEEKFADLLNRLFPSPAFGPPPARPPKG
ncbi:MAG: CotH kinase family protein [Gemmataceae bacterium]